MISPLSSFSLMYGLLLRISSIVFFTLFTATSCTYCLFLVDFSPVKVLFVIATAGFILVSISVMLPNFTSSIVLFTAPQLSCPSTIITLEPDFTAYSILPNWSTFTKLPATLPTNRSPIPWSKTSSTGTLLSIQLRTYAFGYCPSTACNTAVEWSLAVTSPVLKRSLPAANC